MGVSIGNLLSNRSQWFYVNVRKRERSNLGDVIGDSGPHLLLYLPPTYRCREGRLGSPGDIAADGNQWQKVNNIKGLKLSRTGILSTFNVSLSAVALCILDYLGSCSSFFPDLVAHGTGHISAYSSYQAGRIVHEIQMQWEDLPEGLRHQVARMKQVAGEW